MNRLNLDFSLNTDIERSEFLQNYLSQPQFITQPLNEDELETCANYVLWGKNSDTGLNAKQSGDVELEAKHSTWDPTATESLDALLESPTFNEATLNNYSVTPYTSRHTTFSRKEALAHAPESLIPSFKDLFRRIDECEIKINYYELAHGRRQQPPRDILRNKFTDEEVQQFQETVTHWNQYKYLKHRHLLVEMRREQYNLRDSFTSVIGLNDPVLPEVIAPVEFDAGIEVLPLGLAQDNSVAQSIFRPFDQLIPSNFKGEELGAISNYYWKKKQYQPTGSEKWINLTEPEHLYEVFEMWVYLVKAAEDASEDSTLPTFISTVKYYISQADLTDIQIDILHQKLRKVKNTDIAFDVNHKYKKTYTPNYISTIFKQRIIPQIAAAASYHQQVIGSIFFPEEFKVCTQCGRTLLKNEINFTRKARSKDGFTTKCKKCEKANRGGN